MTPAMSACGVLLPGITTPGGSTVTPDPSELAQDGWPPPPPPLEPQPATATRAHAPASAHPASAILLLRPD